MSLPQEFPGGCDRLYVRQSVTLGAGATARLEEIWKYEGNDIAHLVYGILEEGTLENWRVFPTVSGVAIADDSEGIRLDTIALDSPPTFNQVDLANIDVRRGEAFAWKVRNDGGGSETLTVTWVFNRKAR